MCHVGGGHPSPAWAPSIDKERRHTRAVLSACIGLLLDPLGSATLHLHRMAVAEQQYLVVGSIRTAFAFGTARRGCKLELNDATRRWQKRRNYEYEYSVP